MEAHQAKEGAMRSKNLRDRARQAEHEQHFYLRTLQEYFRPGIRWLDAGCGHSLVPKWLRGSEEIERRFLEDAKIVVGADIDRPSLSTPSRIRRIACNLTSLAFRDESFDLVTCNMVVEHLSDPRRIFGEFFRVMRPSGILIILTPNTNHPTNMISRLTPFAFHQWVLTKLGERSTADVFPTLYKCNTRSSMRKVLEEAGFVDPTVHMLPGRPRLVDLGLLFYLEYSFYRFSLRFEAVREILCAVAQKP
jgi:ubiquinone/menaquinone biosynthesis C-methylase UbiE